MKEKFLTFPNLPEKRVTLAAVGNYPAVIEALNNEGIKTLSFESQVLPDETKRHSDMLLCHTGQENIFISPEIPSDELTGEGFRVRLSEAVGSKYPDDVRLNIAIGRSLYIFNPKTVDSALNSFLSDKGFTEIHTNQGYTKCSVCFVTEKAIITEDPSVYNALKTTDIDVLFISHGDIYLSSAHSGFFGGSTGKISNDILAVAGELKYHRDGTEIKKFCRKYGVEIKELIKGRIIDIGSILPLKEMR